jgi:hypothetical protein
MRGATLPAYVLTVYDTAEREPTMADTRGAPKPKPEPKYVVDCPNWTMGPMTHDKAVLEAAHTNKRCQNKHLVERYDPDKHIIGSKRDRR